MKSSSLPDVQFTVYIDTKIKERIALANCNWTFRCSTDQVLIFIRTTAYWTEVRKYSGWKKNFYLWPLLQWHSYDSMQVRWIRGWWPHDRLQKQRNVSLHLWEPLEPFRSLCLSMAAKISDSMGQFLYGKW